MNEFTLGRRLITVMDANHILNGQMLELAIGTKNQSVNSEMLS